MAKTGAPRAEVAGDDPVQVLALVTACAFALLIGLTLATVLATASAVQAPWGQRWRALAQVHGQTMALGWAGLFVLGMAARLLPRFGGAPLRRPLLLRWALAMITAALLLRALTQPLAETSLARWLLFASGLLLLVGVLAFAAPGLLTLARPLRARRPFAAFAAAGLFWLLVAGLLTVRALARVLADGAMTVPQSYDAPLLYAEIDGFLLSFIVGVTSRTIPVLYAWKVRPALIWSALALLQLGVGATVVAALAGDGVDGAWWLSCAGSVVLALGLLCACGCMGVWRSPSRLRERSRPVGLLLRSAFGWAAVAALLLLYGAFAGARHHAPPPAYTADAVRHVIGIGVVSMLIVGMTYLVGHTFAEERANDAGMARRLRTYEGLLSVAAILRAVAALLEGRVAPLWRFWLMAGAGALVFLAVALFAYRLYWGLRHHYVPPSAPSGKSLRSSATPVDSESN
jgi:hypothetical protein